MKPILTAVVMVAAFVVAVVAAFQIFREEPMEEPAPGTTANAPPPEQTPPSTAKAPALAETPKTASIKWRMASIYAGDLPYFGSLGKRFSRRISASTDGALEVEFFEPDVLLPPLTGFDAVAERRVDAVWGAAAYWVDEVPTAPWFSGMPFGLTGAEYQTWLAEGGGQALWDEAYAAAGVKGIACGMAPADGAGWYRKKIRTTKDLKRLKVRIFGYGALVLENLGATISQIGTPELFEALKSGKLDGAEFSIPSIDVKLGLAGAAGYYYLPGWQQPTTVLELLVNKTAFDSLDSETREVLSAVCADNIRRGLQDAETTESAALKKMETSGIKVRTLPDPVLSALRQSWQQIRDAKSLADPDFRRIAESVARFRERSIAQRKATKNN